MIAEGVAGSQEAFVQRMNETAQHLGMTRTNFANVNGLPDERQVTTARDLAKLARAIIIAFPEHADLFTTVQVQVGKQIMRTHNGLLVSIPGADGMKTGFICNSEFNVVASATRDGRKLVAVVLGEQSLATRRVRATDLLENGFRRYFWKSLFGVQDRLHELAIIAQDRRLAGKEGMRFRPAETEIERQRAFRGLFVVRPGILGYIEARNTNRARVACDLHHLVEHDGRLLAARMTTSLEAHRIDGAVDFVGSDDLCDHVSEPVALRQVNGFEADPCRMGKTILVEVSNHDDRSARIRADAAAARPTRPAPAT